MSTFEASCSLQYPEDDQIAFREGLMRKLGPLFQLKSPMRTAPAERPLTKDELRERAYLVRSYKAICRVDNPTKLEARFRASVTAKLRTAFALPPAAGANRPPAMCPHN